ncbi:MAG: DUF5916 domain-containing protein [Planctomycetota bacterium]
MRALLVCFLVPCGVAAAQPSLELARAEVPPIIDGRLDDPIWQQTVGSDAFTQVEPDAGATPDRRTVVRAAYDESTLYIAVRCEDEGPVRAVEMARDGSLNGDDTVLVVIDPFGDERNGFLFALAAGGARIDAILEGGRRSFEWDGIWRGETQVTPNAEGGGWSAEFAIPFDSIPFDPDATAWGFNVERRAPRTGEIMRWSGARREREVTDLDTAGLISGFDGSQQQGFGLTFKPFGLLSGGFDGDPPEADGGFDLFYRITPTISAAITFNTDFAEAEVDQRRVNLTRFPLFFEERRDFFLEDAGIFEFGGINRSPRPYFSRRIGIVDGETKDILIGGRVTGRVGRTRFGVLNVQMQDDDELGSKNLGVARVVRDVLDNSTVGLILTNGRPDIRGSNTLLGGDFNFVRTEFAGGALTVSGWAQGTFDDPTGMPDGGDDNLGYAVGGRFDYRSDEWRLFGFVAHVDDNFVPGLGFVARPGEREHIASITRTFRRPEGILVREIDIRAVADVFTSESDIVRTAEVTFPSVTVESAAGDFVRGEFVFERDNLNDPFEIAPGVVITPDTYDTFGTDLDFGTSETRPFSVFGGFGFREFFDGERYDGTLGIEWRPSPLLSAEAEFIYNDVNLPQGDFEVEILRSRADLQFSPDLTWSNVVQWDNQSNRASVNSRVRWEYSPGSEIFVVYNEGFDVDGSELSSSERLLTIKIGAAFRI